MVPFNTEVRAEIKERSNGVSELSGRQAGEEGPLVCAHLNHTRDDHYHNPELGLRVTRFEEAAYHQMHTTCPEKIGMKDIQNKSVVMSYMKRFLNSDFSLEEVRQRMGEAIELWEEFLEG